MQNKDDLRGHMPFLRGVVEDDLAQLEQKEREYGSSWKARGGVNAWFMLCRKFDRLEQSLDPAKRVHGEETDNTIAPLGRALGLPIPAYDILLAGVLDSRVEGIIDTIGDLRRYLTLVEAEIRFQQHKIGNADPMQQKSVLQEAADANGGVLRLG